MAFNTITDGDFTVESAVSPVRFSQPFEGDAGNYVLEQDFWIHKDYFTPLALNNPHPDFPDYILVKESQTTAAGNGIVSWTRTYCSLPASRNDWTTTAYEFIGFLGALSPIVWAGNPTIPPGRPKFSKIVKCRIQNDYFITLNSSPSTPATTTGAPSTQAQQQPIRSLGKVQLLTDPSQITIIPKQAYYEGQGYWTAGPTWTPVYKDPVQAQIHGLPLGAIWDTTGNLATTTVGVASVPTRTLYNTWVSLGQEIVAEDSTISRWMGNCFARQTKYVVAI